MVSREIFILQYDISKEAISVYIIQHTATVAAELLMLSITQVNLVIPLDLHYLILCTTSRAFPRSPCQNPPIPTTLTPPSQDISTYFLLTKPQLIIIIPQKPCPAIPIFLRLENPLHALLRERQHLVNILLCHRLLRRTSQHPNRLIRKLDVFRPIRTPFPCHDQLGNSLKRRIFLDVLPLSIPSTAEVLPQRAERPRPRRPHHEVIEDVHAV